MSLRGSVHRCLTRQQVHDLAGLVNESQLIAIRRTRVTDAQDHELVFERTVHFKVGVGAADDNAVQLPCRDRRALSLVNLRRS